MSAVTERGYELLKKLTLAGAPGSGATITLWDSSSNNGFIERGRHYKMIIVNIITSADSAANGLTFEESNDGGVTWDVVGTGDSITTAGGYTKAYKKVSAPEVRVRYHNSANVLTTWRGSVMGDVMERGNG